ncbi:PREDICTED: chromodomain-helicase-DNA-binding protein 1-like [Priapulus caudatus]|uniref:Chromodomain-helicase-DNA-binding protein 1-like n=1 Tax=Priapulus caudatus TaxID=37621 RepID=A0ABM1EJB7_PRICU|nr:PREDICTED: chromodomain-helicase-DNA-binding protein 1-like [Priapulus caudatus]
MGMKMNKCVNTDDLRGGDSSFLSEASLSHVSEASLSHFSETSLSRVSEASLSQVSDTLSCSGLMLNLTDDNAVAVSRNRSIPPKHAHLPQPGRPAEDASSWRRFFDLPQVQRSIQRRLAARVAGATAMGSIQRRPRVVMDYLQRGKPTMTMRRMGRPQVMRGSDAGEDVLVMKSHAPVAGMLLVTSSTARPAAPVILPSRTSLHHYQVDGVNWLAEHYHRHHGSILADEMGLGKTVQTVALFVYLRGEIKTKPFLVLSPLSVLSNWQTELKRFAPKLDLELYVGDKEKREVLRDRLTNVDYEYDVLLTTYELFLRDAAFFVKTSWSAIVVDEAHRIKNQESLLYEALTSIDSKHRVLLTGTPVQNNLAELYSLLHFVAPRIFTSSQRKEFVDTYETIQTDEELRKEMHSLLQPFLLRRVKSEVMADLPKKSEVIFYHGLAVLQKTIYKAILTKDMEWLGSFFAQQARPKKVNIQNVLMQLRKCVNHPYLFPGVEPEPFMMGEHLVEASAKLFALDQLLHFLGVNGHKVLLFSQMTAMLDIVQDYLGYRGYSYERLDGSVRGEERFLSIENFNKQDDTFIFLLSTKAGGVGLNLTAADTVIFIDSDFNPQNDLQAAARAHRIGQTSCTVCMADMIQFGLSNLLGESGDNVNREVTCEEFERILGKTVNSRWTDIGKDEEDLLKKSTCMGDSIYSFEGKDYSKETSADDRKAFNLLLLDGKENIDSAIGQERGLRSRNAPSPQMFLPDRPSLPRKVLTEEETVERAKKRADTMMRKAQEREAAEVQRAQETRRKQEQLWTENNYTSSNICLDDGLEGEEREEVSLDDDDNELRTPILYVCGDVTYPAHAGDEDAIVVHCADDSGKWGSGGLFSAIAVRSGKAIEQYELAGEMQDLALGDAHLVPLDGDETREKGRDWLAIIIAQHRSKAGNLSGIKLAALSQALQRVYRAAVSHGASVHLPRIGHATPSFNWYGTERLIKKHLANRGIPTYIYYYDKQKARAKRQRHGSSESTEENASGKKSRLDDTVDDPGSATTSRDAHESRNIAGTTSQHAAGHFSPERTCISSAAVTRH